ncbi:hypothetical protein KKF34_07715 [Myxococcota bacterium]|nr:hypothetical protein [Myxococcota bacterium]MBU1379990.1 hypothetical protein [Myxococcota bacterium]MBU1496747.1 hypothetical protein [Myxococcota bacterium]
MKTIKIFLAVTFITAFTAFPANAQEKVIQQLDLGSEALDGELMGPDQGLMSGRKISIMNSLIQFRDNFIQEMIISAEDL